MPLAPLFTFSLLVHLLLGWRVVPDLALYSSTLAWLFGIWTALSAVLMPLGMVSLRFQRGHLGVWTALSAVLMPLGMASLRFQRAHLGEWLTWVGLLCMGLFSGLFSLMVLRELVLLVLTVLHWTGVDFLDLTAFRVQSVLAITPLALAMTVVGFWNARRTAAVVQVDVPIANLPPALEGFSIAQISDIHVGPTIKQRYLQRIVDRVNSLDADVVAITGDLVDGPAQSIGPLVDPLQKLRSTYGSFFVTGNHEYYSGAAGWVDKVRSLGIQVLMNEHVVLQHDKATLVLAGVTDYSAGHFDKQQTSSPEKALAGAPAGLKVLLAHQPRSAEAAATAGFDLQLSGHTHGGQFWPWGYFVRFQQPFTAGLHRLRNLWVYTSRGTGYWGPPKRFGAPSEITHLRLVRA